jgi:hypothetical protein
MPEAGSFSDYSPVLKPQQSSLAAHIRSVTGSYTELHGMNRHFFGNHGVWMCEEKSRELNRLPL